MFKTLSPEKQNQASTAAARKAAVASLLDERPVDGAGAGGEGRSTSLVNQRGLLARLLFGQISTRRYPVVGLEMQIPKHTEGPFP